ncbi:MAG TPA: zinc-dependent metalloprotease [Parasegetibacter sp.]
MLQTFNLKKILIAVLLISTSSIAFSQRPGGNNGGGAPAPGGNAAANRPGPKPYGEVITNKAVTSKGLFIVHKVDDRYYFEIPDSVLGRDILVMTRVSKAGADMRAGMTGYAGDDVNSNVIAFENGPNNKVFLLRKSHSEFSKDSTKEMYHAVTRSNLQPIAAAFDVKVLPSDSNHVVIDVTDFISGDNDILHFDSRNKSSWRIGGFQPDKSYITSVKSFPINTEIRAVKTYARAGGGGGANPLGGGGGGGAQGTSTVELATSLVILPKDPMKPRYFDPRVGYFTVSYTDFDVNPHGVKRLQLAKRWRLEPKPEDVAKYKRGELVEPQKPIIFYIDPATPKKWIPYLIQGVNDWQKAFEKAGFKNAIIGKVAPTPEEDPEWSLDDARHSAIVYKPSSVANASGPSTADPRSGEIIESHINWYHNVMQLLRNWYFIQASAVDPRARTMQFDDKLMGELIRFVSSHEVGHTLGLRHNFGSSSTTPVEKLRDKKWLEQNGHTPSIMDYARFNYVAQPEDNINDKGMFPRVGDYDIWAIEWGYKWTDKSVDEETKMMAKLTSEKQKNPRLWFGTETNPDDPRSQSEDLGDNSMVASEYGIKNLKRLMPNLTKWTVKENESFDDLKTMYDEIVGQFGRYIGHVVKNVGGIMETPKMAGEPGYVYEYVSKARQKEAMSFLNQHVFTTPEWLINTEVFARTGANPTSIILARQEQALNRLLSASTMNKLINAELALGAEAYTLPEMMNDLKSYIWTELNSRSAVSVYRRNLQKSYVEQLAALINPPAPAATGGAAGNLAAMLGGGGSSAKKSDVISVAKGTLKALKNEIKAAIPGVTDSMTRYHLEDVLERIELALDPK